MDDDNSATAANNNNNNRPGSPFPSAAFQNGVFDEDGDTIVVGGGGGGLASSSSVALRKSAPGMVGRAKLNTIKITLTLVGAFLACWTPYYVMCMW